MGQEDPLSHFLFVIIMEVLSRMLSATVNGVFLLGFSIGSRNSDVVNTSHLLFANDILVFFCGAQPNHLPYLCALFFCFKAVSDLKIDLAKSDLVPMGNIDNVDRLVGILSCRVSSLSLKYFVFRWGPSIRPSLFGVMLLKK